MGNHERLNRAFTITTSLLWLVVAAIGLFAARMIGFLRRDLGEF
jgi:hypothetical protein